MKSIILILSYWLFALIMVLLVITIFTQTVKKHNKSRNVVIEATYVGKNKCAFKTNSFVYIDTCDKYMVGDTLPLK